MTILLDDNKQVTLLRRSEHPKSPSPGPCRPPLVAANKRVPSGHAPLFCLGEIEGERRETERNREEHRGTDRDREKQRETHRGRELGLVFHFSPTLLFPPVLRFFL